MAGVTIELDEALRAEVRQAVLDALAEQRQQEPSRWLDVEGAAQHLATTPAAIRAMVKRRQIPFHRTPVGGLRFDRAELNEWVRHEQNNNPGGLSCRAS